MVDSRLASGDPIVIPFQNWASYESSAGVSTSSTTQFTVASQSVNGLLGTFRAGNYDTAPSSGGALAGTLVINTDYYGFGGGAQTPVIGGSTTFQFSIDSKV